MKLWTWQTFDFDITTGRVIHGRSEVEAGEPGLRVAQGELFKRVGDDQIIWCYVRKQESNWFNSSVTPPRREWEFDVPFRDVIEIISEAVWLQIFETHKGNAPEELWARLFLKERFAGIDEAAIAGHPDAKETTALVRHPVPEKYVSRCPAM